MLLYNVNRQALFQETKIWDRVCLRNIQNFQISMKILLWHDLAQKQDFDLLWFVSIRESIESRQSHIKLLRIT